MLSKELVAASTVPLVLSVCITIIRGLHIDPWLLWPMTGAAMTSAMVFGAFLRERHPFNWNFPRRTENDYRRISRRIGVLSVCCMIACNIVGLAERFFPSVAISLLHPIEVWLLWGALAGWSTALGLTVVRKIRFGKAARLA